MIDLHIDMGRKLDGFADLPKIGAGALVVSRDQDFAASIGRSLVDSHLDPLAVARGVELIGVRVVLIHILEHSFLLFGKMICFDQNCVENIIIYTGAKNSKLGGMGDADKN